MVEYFSAAFITLTLVISVLSLSLLCLENCQGSDCNLDYYDNYRRIIITLRIKEILGSVLDTGTDPSAVQSSKIKSKNCVL